MNLKETITQYTGEQLEPENGEVTVEMIASVLTDEFPELMLAVAQENFLRGYQMALDDVEAVENERMKALTEGENSEAT